MGISKYKESAPGTVYHLFNRGNNKQNIFFEDSDYRFYLSILKRYKKETGFSLIGYCLMPNHVHLLVRQDQDFSPSKLISKLHTTYAMFINDKYKKVGHLFQGRFKQKIVSEENYLIQLISYLHLNPVKDGICSKPELYNWSSFNWYQQEPKSKRSGICDFDVITELGIKELASREVYLQAKKVSSIDAFD